MEPNNPPLTACGTRRGLVFKRFGIAAFLFFLIKGMAWLMVPALFAAGWLRS